MEPPSMHLMPHKSHKVANPAVTKQEKINKNKNIIKAKQQNTKTETARGKRKPNKGNK